MTELADPKVVVKDLLNAEWDAANTSESSPPEFRTGWRDSDLTAPQVTVSHDEESPTSPTGFNGLGPNGPTAELRGTAQVNVWTRRDICEAHPRTVGHEFTEEVKRIIREFGPSIADYDGFTINGLDASAYRYLSWLGREHMPEPVEAEDAPVVERFLVTVGYEYLDR